MNVPGRLKLADTICRRIDEEGASVAALASELGMSTNAVHILVYVRRSLVDSVAAEMIRADVPIRIAREIGRMTPDRYYGNEWNEDGTRAVPPPPRKRGEALKPQNRSGDTVLEDLQRMLLARYLRKREALQQTGRVRAERSDKGATFRPAGERAPLRPQQRLGLAQTALHRSAADYLGCLELILAEKKPRDRRRRRLEAISDCLRWLLDPTIALPDVTVAHFEAYDDARHLFRS